jgi:hypothetical protein
MKFFNKVYDLLIQFGGASERGRFDFVYAHTRDPHICDEYRFQGSLGFGGKYRRLRNTVDCYREDETPERLQTIERLNAELKKISSESAWLL